MKGYVRFKNKNQDDEKLGDTKWAGTHESSAMKSTTTIPTTRTTPVISLKMT
jgi:hypothetical protein